MGREAHCGCTLGGQREQVKAVLESTQLMLRGALKRSWAISELRAVEVVGDELRLTLGEERLALALGADEAARWARKITTPPPSLAHKLGLSTDHPAWVIGELDDEALLMAVNGLRAPTPEQARITLAIVRSAEQLAAALPAHERLPHSRHLWVVHPKGRDSRLTDSMVRRHLHGQGYVDSKTSAVSATLTATRYAKR